MRRPPPEAPGPGQESVWDYPRPPALVPSTRHVRVRHGDVLIAESSRAFRVLETSHPPTWYLPRADVVAELRHSATPPTVCEWKGVATYWDVLDPAVGAVEAAAWSYETPTPGFAALAGHVTFYPAVFACEIDGGRVRPQEGGFYGGWITDDVVGPFKGGPGSWGW